MGQKMGIVVLGICLIWGMLASAQELSLVYQEGNKVVVGKGFLQDFGTLKLMYLEGSPFEMGLQQGLLITYDQDALRFKDSANLLYNPLAGKHAGLKKLEVGFKQFYFKGKLLPMIKRNIPEEYWEEMQGLALGLTRGEEPVDLEAVLMANVYLDLGANYACTSFAVYNGATGDGSLLHGRNLDSPGMETMAQQGYVAVFNPDQGYPFITHIYPLSCGKIVVVPHDPGDVDVVIRISEPFGFNFDPVEFVIDGLLDLQRKRVSLTYHNLSGSLINVGGAVSWGPSGERSIFLSFPISTATQQLSFGQSRIGNDVVWGAYAGNAFLIKREAWELRTEGEV